MGESEPGRGELATSEGVLLFLALAFDAFRNHGKWKVLPHMERVRLIATSQRLQGRLETLIGPLFVDTEDEVDKFPPPPDTPRSFALSANEVTVARAVAEACFEHFDDEDFQIFFGYSREEGLGYLAEFDQAVAAAEIPAALQSD